MNSLEIVFGTLSPCSEYLCNLYFTQKVQLRLKCGQSYVFHDSVAVRHDVRLFRSSLGLLGGIGKTCCVLVSKRYECEPCESKESAKSCVILEIGVLLPKKRASDLE